MTATLTALSVQNVDCEWHKGLPIYAADFFLRQVGSEYGWLGGFRDGELACILPYAVIRKPGFRLVRFQTAVIATGAELTLEEERDFLNGAVQCLKQQGVDMIMPGTNAAVFRTYPEGAVAAPYGTYIKDLAQSEEALMKEIHPTFRYNIRRAKRDGVVVKSGLEYTDTAHQLITDTLKRSNQSFKSAETFANHIHALGEHVLILLAEFKGEIQGCMVAPFSDYAAYTWYCGSRSEPALGAMHMLHWEAMMKFRAMGVRRFDFQGVRIDPEQDSKQEGIENFKRRFGGTLINGYTWKYPFSTLKYAAYNAAMRLLKGGDVVDLERARRAQAEGPAS